MTRFARGYSSQNEGINYDEIDVKNTFQNSYQRKGVCKAVTRIEDHAIPLPNHKIRPPQHLVWPHQAHQVLNCLCEILMELLPTALKCEVLHEGMI